MSVIRSVMGPYSVHLSIVLTLPLSYSDRFVCEGSDGEKSVAYNNLSKLGLGIFLTS